MVQKRRSVWAGIRGPELGNVPFEIRPDEVLPPESAGFIRRGKKARGEPAPAPQAHELARADLPHIERSKLEITDAAGEALAGLAHQFHRCGTQNEELPRFLAPPDPPVDDPSQLAEQVGSPMDLVEDHELVSHRFQIS